MAEQTNTVSFTETVLANLEQEIINVKVSGSYHYHKMRRAGLAKRSLTIRYQIVQVMSYLAGKQFKKYRKHYTDHRKQLEIVDAMPFYVESKDGKMVNNYNTIGKAYEEILESLKESEEIIAKSGAGKDVKLRQFKSATKAIKDAVTSQLADKTEAEVIAEAEENKAA